MKKYHSKIITLSVFRFFFTYLVFVNFLTIYSLSYSNHVATTDSIDNSEQPPSYEYFQENFLRYGDFVYKDNIKTVLFHKKGFDLSPPLIRHNSSEKLILSFDDLDANHKDYYYTIIHCNADWQPSDLSANEYIEGFIDGQIQDYRFSVNTIINYTHYKLEFPNEDVSPRISGNYILKVYLYGNPDDVVLTRKFKIYEQLVGVEGSVEQATLVSMRDEMQEVNFVINTRNYRVSNPYRDIKVTIKQNGRTDNVIWGLKPKLILGDELIYEYNEKNLFEGGNEFRRFDIRSLKYSTESVSDIMASHSHYEVYLLEDKRRSSLRYTSQDDINGKLYIENRDGFGDHLDPDYAWVYFSLSYNIPEQNGNFYIVGSLSDWNYTTKNRMNYSFRDKKYHASMLLKQGYYNYQYIFLEDGAKKGNTFRAEGSHSVTENEYSIYVYHRKPGSKHDSLIGVLHLNSGIN